MSTGIKTQYTCPRRIRPSTHFPTKSTLTDCRIARYFISTSVYTVRYYLDATARIATKRTRVIFRIRKVSGLLLIGNQDKMAPPEGWNRIELLRVLGAGDVDFGKRVGGMPRVSQVYTIKAQECNSLPYLEQGRHPSLYIQGIQGRLDHCECQGPQHGL